MKGYTVFNVEQVEGLPAHYYAHPQNPLPLSERIDNADRFMRLPDKRRYLAEFLRSEYPRRAKTLGSTQNPNQLDGILV